MQDDTTKNGKGWGKSEIDKIKYVTIPYVAYSTKSSYTLQGPISLKIQAIESAYEMQVEFTGLDLSPGTLWNCTSLSVIIN